MTDERNICGTCITFKEKAKNPEYICTYNCCHVKPGDLCICSPSHWEEKPVCESISATSDEAISALLTENARIGAELKRMTEMANLLSGNRDRSVRADALKDVIALVKSREIGSENPNGWLWKQDSLLRELNFMLKEMKV
jgi:hypothetical protein